MVRDQLMEGKGKEDMQRTPVFVIGNKADCILASLASVRGGHHHQFHPPHSSSHDHFQQHHHHHHHHHEPPPAMKELAAIVKKQWKSFYWEVSALHQWRVHSLFLRILEAVVQQRKEHDQRKDPDHHDEHHHHHFFLHHHHHHHHHTLVSQDQTPSHPKGPSTSTALTRQPSSVTDQSSSCLIL